MPNLHPARILTGNWPTTSADLRAVTERLTDFWEKLRAKRPAPEPDPAIEAWFEPADRSAPLSVTETRRVQARARSFVERRDAQLEAVPNRNRLGPQLTALTRAGRAAFVSALEADEIAAALHDRAPWMEGASCLMMKELRRRTAQGPGLAGAPPMILSGPPGIGKSAWARHLAELLGVPVIQIDLGAAQSGAFSLVGVERGWGSAGMGMLTQTILTDRIANPVVIIDEIGLARETMNTSGGSTMAGMIPALMSLIDPVTARNWTDPYLRVDFDMSRVTWVMTTNAHEHLPQPLLDRCQVVNCRNPTPAEYAAALGRMGDGRLWAEGDAGDPVFRALSDHLRQHPPRSLRAVRRLVDRAEEITARPRMN
ncbi:hypothetical protein A6J80_18440 [Paracoccus yeei]|uniref:AAA+ ATPase domain-containing protein n=1 Tax=Paracoccus yeei TaxID=147645 RepID=A0A1V0GW25_9RHOB|nr:AAA family ATPase [Paracoccus yeei]ARC38074.1 hypothetical protein A6J80_18440 [Paracoccus yeei]